MKLSLINEIGHWDLAPGKYPNSLLQTKKNKPKRHSFLLHPGDRERFLRWSSPTNDEYSIREWKFSRRDMLKMATAALGNSEGIGKFILRLVSDKYAPALLAYKNYLANGGSPHAVNNAIFNLVNGYVSPNEDGSVGPEEDRGFPIRQDKAPIPANVIIGYEIAALDKDDSPLAIIERLMTGDNPELFALPGYENFRMDAFNATLKKYGFKGLIDGIEQLVGSHGLESQFLFNVLAELVQKIPQVAELVKFSPTQLLKMSESPNGALILQKNDIVSQEFANLHRHERIEWLKSNEINRKNIAREKEEAKQRRADFERKIEQERRAQEASDKKSAQTKRNGIPDREWHGSMHQWFESRITEILDRMIVEFRLSDADWNLSPQPHLSRQSTSITKPNESSIDEPDMEPELVGVEPEEEDVEPVDIEPDATLLHLSYGMYKVYKRYLEGHQDPLFSVLKRRGSNVDWVETYVSPEELERIASLTEYILLHSDDEGEIRTAQALRDQLDELL